jgi:hypothetical protein
MSVALYRRYRSALRTIPFDGPFMPYDWTRLPNPLSGVWIPYAEMLREFTYELANSINDLTHSVRRLRAWAKVVPTLTDNQKGHACHEFIDELATLAVNLPYVIRDRFIFAAAHLCHQAHITCDGSSWADDLPRDRKIKMKHADARGSRWENYPKLKQNLDCMAAEGYSARTHDFRNSYNHRFSPRFVIGITQMVKREEVDKESGRIYYGLGGIEALQLDQVIILLTAERATACSAFEAFQELIHEQSEAIFRFENS